MAMNPPDNADDDEERTIVRPPSARAAGAMAPTAAIAFPSSLAPARGTAAAPGHTLPIGTRLRDYEIAGLIGEGGFGIVYLAWDHSLQRKVAIKEYMPASMASRVGGSSAIVVKSDRHLDTFKAGLKSFVNEARLLARFDHPSLVKVYRFWEENGTAYMVMPFYEGPTLKTALAELGHVPSEGELRTWLDPLLDALTVMHAAQCFHRDIAPDNILLTASGPLLLDFGAARRVIGDMTHALTVVLKPGYAPIEQYGDVASMTQGAWTDLYALACVVYYAITGKAPMSSVERLMDDRLEPIARIAAGRYGAAFLGAIDAALAVRPQDRPQNVARFRALLDADLPAAVPATPTLTWPAAPHEDYASTELHSYSTVPGTLTPVLATQLLARAPAESAPATEAERPEAAAFARTSGPATLAPMPMNPALSPPFPAAAATWADAGASRRTSRVPLLIVALIIAALGLGGVVFWALQRQGGGAATPISDAASAIALPPPTAPASAAIAAPVASSAAVPAAAKPSSHPATSTDEVSRASAEPPPAAPPRSGEAEPTASPRDTTPISPQAPPARPRRDPAATRATTPAEAKPEVQYRAAGGARCSDILQKASLEPLTSEEAAYLKRECR
jgi:serine/threonine protein kinase